MPVKILIVPKWGNPTPQLQDRTLHVGKRVSWCLSTKNWFSSMRYYQDGLVSMLVSAQLNACA